ncbi:hypothetical protein RhiirA5_473883 [Rhizophagus irregularis]|uniref:MATA-HMG n=4 Tax=Rhizophagus irregularis TaxID=588596 RepID=A0A1B1EU15_9GLOM|nr:MATA-HMG [Rhizophagus irregularis]EXX75206.1 Rox1p [Rhizophagus irregularis DAOM 197198w]GBC38634.1 hypothetical protein GLOIN_2v1669592 [Rhizophagus irregularis DAOM 181602=DAOM 197198]ANQ32307.1 MATA-HMG [Rhizophagus irregularis]ANQ32308.1 MATA-HMG [Rhizophagus irregularis]
MSLQTSSLSDLADILIQKLDRERIFPPSFNKPEELVNISKRNAKPPRPPNGFLLCRKNVHQEAKRRGICNMRVISKVTGMLWRAATPDEKEEYEKLAIKVHNLHSQRYPGYKYRPTTRDRSSESYHPYIFSSSLIEDTPEVFAPSEIEQPARQTFLTNTSHNLFDFTQEQLDFMTLYLGSSFVTTNISQYENNSEDSQYENNSEDHRDHH